MQSLLLYLAAIAVLVLPFVLPNLQGDFEKSLEGDHFTVFYHSGSEDAALRVLKAAERVYPRVSRVLNYTHPSRIGVYVTSSREEFRRLAGYKATEGRVVMGTWTKGAIYLFDPVEGATVNHEVVHGMLHHSLGIDEIPFWFDEGLAVYLSPKKGGSTSAVNRTDASFPKEWEENIVLTKRESQHTTLFKYDEILLPSVTGEAGRFMSIKDMEESITVSPLLYAEATSIFHFIEERYGAEKITEVIVTARESGEVKLGVEKALGISFEEFKKEWKSYIFRSSMNVKLALISVKNAREDGRRGNFENVLDKLFWSLAFYNEGKFARASNLARQTIVAADEADKLPWEEDFWNFISY